MSIYIGQKVPLEPAAHNPKKEEEEKRKRSIWEEDKSLAAVMDDE